MLKIKTRINQLKDFVFFSNFKMKNMGIRLVKNYLLVVEKTSQDGAVEDLVVGVVVVVVGEELVNLGAVNLDGDTHLHHHKKNHKDHNHSSRHCWSLKDLYCLAQRCTIGIFVLQKKTSNELEIECFIVVYQTVRETS